MTIFLSYKLRFFSFYSILLVVLLHANIIEYSTDYSLNLQKFITCSVTRIAVPLFFIISGYLFFNDKQVSLSFWKRQYTHRAKTILLPYIIWTLFGYILLYTYNGFSLSIGDITFNPPKTVYQLWFLKDLIICICLSPLLYYLIEKFKYLSLVILFVLVDYYYIVEGSSIFDFALGIFLAINKFSFIQNRKKYGIITFILGISWLIGCYFQTLYYTEGYHYACHLNILLGITFHWNLYNVIFYKNKFVDLTKKIFSSTFFIYLFHEPLLTVIKKTEMKFLDLTVINTLIIYFTSFTISVLISIYVAQYLKKRLSSIYEILTGGRI